MEPMSLIMAALTVGAEKAAEAIVPDAYKSLKSLIIRKFAGEPKAEMVLSEHEQDPETYQAPLKKKLAEAGADKDEEIIKKAQELLKQLKPEAAANGKYSIKAEQIKGIVGDISGGKIDQTIN